MPFALESFDTPSTVSMGQEVSLKQGHNLVRLRIDELYLRPGNYVVGLWLDKTGTGDDVLDYIESAFEIEVVNVVFQKFSIDTEGLVICKFRLLEVT